MSLRGKILNGLSWTAIASLSNAIAQLIKVSILARILDKSDFGLMSIVLLLVGFISIIMDFGITAAILHKQQMSKKEYSSLFYFNIIFSVLLFVLLMLFSKPFALFYKEPQLIQFIRISSMILIFSAFGKVFKTILQKQMMFKYLSIVELCANILSVIVAIILAFNEYGIYSLIYSYITLYAFENIVYFYVGIKQKIVGFYFSISEIKDSLILGSNQLVGELIAYFNRDLDILILGKLLNIEILGVYTLIKQLANKPFRIINPIIYKVLTPAMSKIIDNNDALSSSYINLNKHVSFVNVLSTIPFLIFPTIIIKLLLGENYSEYGFLLQLFSIYYYVKMLNSSLGTLIVSTGKTKLGMYWSIWTLLFFPIPIVLGSLFSIYHVVILLTLYYLLIIYPLWYFLIKNMIQITFIEYLKSFIPAVDEFRKLFK